MAGSYAGKVLQVNLSTGQIEVEDLDFELAHQYVGGRGFGVKVLYDNLKAGVDPLSSENLFLLAAGPLTGTAAPASGRLSASSKSPLTGTVFDSNCGGSVGPELKRAGFDMVIVKGRSPKPVYLWIRDGKAELRDAKKLWGLLVDEADRALKAELGDKEIKTCIIGPAGENLVRMASIMVEGHRAFGRGGLGAVLGSKNLKAVVIRGKGNPPQPANPHAFRKEVKLILEVLRRNPVTGDSLGRYGTPMLVTPVNKAGVFPVRNFQGGFLEDAERLSGEQLLKVLQTRRYACYGCPIGCGRITRLPDGRLTGGPEYETIWALGPNCGILDLEVIAYLNDLCNRYGIDTISMGGTLAFTLEAFEKKLISEKDTGGVKLRWGDPETLALLIEHTAYRRGFGSLLAEGSARLAEKFGGSEFAIHVKGLEIPAYDPRGVKGMGLSYATSNRGGCHLRAYLVMSEILSSPRYLNPLKVEGKAELVRSLQDIYAMLDSLIMCKFTCFALFQTLKYEPKFYARLLATATGFYFDEEEFRKAGERIYNLERLFNVREGFDYRHDSLPARLLTSPLPEGPSKGEVAQLEHMLAEYYRIRGWNFAGQPTDAKLMELEIISEPRWPKIQVALDLRDLDEALRIGEAAYRGGAEWVEAGTPLIKNVGMEAVRRLRQRIPSATLVADLKTLDTGWLETEIAAQAGADIVCLSGLAHDNTIRDAVGCAKKYGVKIMVDLIEVKDPVRRAVELERLGVDYICAHTGIDVQRDKAEEIDRKFETLSRLTSSVKVPVAAAGGIRADTARRIVKGGVKILIIGGAITRASNPEAATRKILEVIRG